MVNEWNETYFAILIHEVINQYQNGCYPLGGGEKIPFPGNMNIWKNSFVKLFLTLSCTIFLNFSIPWKLATTTDRLVIHCLYSLYLFIHLSFIMFILLCFILLCVCCSQRRIPSGYATGQIYSRVNCLNQMCVSDTLGHPWTIYCFKKG